MQAQIHSTRLVRENTIAKQPIQQPIRFLFVIVPFYADEYSEALTDFAHRFSVHDYSRVKDTLQQSDHLPLVDLIHHRQQEYQANIYGTARAGASLFPPTRNVKEAL